MKRLLIVTLIGLLVGAGLVSLIIKDPGYVLISYGHYTIESSIWVFSGVFLLFVLTLYVLLRVVRSLLGSAGFIRRWYGGMSERQANKNTRLGFVAMLKGDETRAKKLLLKSAPNVELPILNYWLAATSYSADENIRQFVFDGIADINVGDESLDKIVQAHFSLKDKKFDQVVEIIKPLESQGKKFPVVYRLLYQAYVGANNWAKALEILPFLRQHHLLKDGEWVLENKRVYWNFFDAEAARHVDVTGNLFRRVWEERPTELKNDSVLAARYTRCLMALDCDEEIEVFLRHWLEKHWHLELVDIYGAVEAVDVKRQLKQAEKWLNDHGDDAVLLLALGRISMRNQLWNKAKDYFEQSYRRQHRPETCAELARLYGNLGEFAKSEKYYREGLIKRLGGLPVLPQPHTKTLSE